MDQNKIDISKYNSKFSLLNRIGRVLWKSCYWIFFRPFDFGIFRRWRNFVLRAFGAKLTSKVNVYASSRIWAPWNLEMSDYSCLGPSVDCYNQGRIIIGANTTISQKTYLCASSHDITDSKHSLIIRPIIIADQVWVAADAFIGPGVIIGQGAVVGARAAVFKDVEPWAIVGGNPAKFIKKREITK